MLNNLYWFYFQKRFLFPSLSCTPAWTLDI